MDFLTSYITVQRPFTAVLTLKGRKLCLYMSYTGLSGPELAAHIHGPAGVGIQSQADVIKTLRGGAVKIPGNGNCFLLDAAEAQDLSAGLWYIVVHTEQCPAGELRGQIFAV